MKITKYIFGIPIKTVDVEPKYSVGDIVYIREYASSDEGALKKVKIIQVLSDTNRYVAVILDNSAIDALKKAFNNSPSGLLNEDSIIAKVEVSDETSNS